MMTEELDLLDTGPGRCSKDSRRSKPSPAGVITLATLSAAQKPLVQFSDVVAVAPSTDHEPPTMAGSTPGPSSIRGRSDRERETLQRPSSIIVDERRNPD